MNSQMKILSNAKNYFDLANILHNKVIIWKTSHKRFELETDWKKLPPKLYFYSAIHIIKCVSEIVFQI